MIADSLYSVFIQLHLIGEKEESYGTLISQMFSSLSLILFGYMLLNVSSRYEIISTSADISE